MTFTQDTPDTFRPTHLLTLPVTQGVLGPARPPITFPAGTPVVLHAAWGDLAYGDTADGWMLTLRMSTDIVPVEDEGDSIAFDLAAAAEQAAERAVEQR